MDQVNTYSTIVIFTLLILFIISSLIVDHYQRGYLFTSRSSNASVFIEQALEKIPICNPEDYRHQRALLYTFQLWTHLVDSYSIPYWIFHKTLFSYTQRHNLLPDDHAIDVAIMSEDLSQLLELRKANYTLEIYLQAFMDKDSNYSSRLSRGIDASAYNARFINPQNNASINIWPVYVHHSDKYILSLIKSLDFNTWILSPVEWTFPLEPCVFAGIKVWCPAMPERLVTMLYGLQGADKTARKCVNNTWIRV